METDARRRAQQRVDRVAAFRAELGELEREQALTLTPEQRAGLERHLDGLLDALNREFGADITESARRISWGMRVAALLGAAALAAALVLFLHRVWGYLPFAVQAAVLIVSPLAVLGAAEVAHRRGVDRVQVGVLVVASAVILKMAVDALGGVLNVAPGPHLLLATGLFGVLLGHAYRLPMVLGAGLVWLCGCTAAVATAVEGSHWLVWVQRAQYLLPPALVLYSVPWAFRRAPEAGLQHVYRWCGAAVGLAGLLLLSTIGHLCCLGPTGDQVAAALQLLGIALGAAVVAHGLILDRGSLVNLGAAAFVVFLFVRLHAWWWEWMPKYLFFLLLGLIALGLLLVFRRLRRRLSGGAR